MCQCSLAAKIYGGAQSCAKCHEKEYASWKKTPHARALQTLIDKGQQFNPECLKCHVTGYRQANGFYTVKHGPSLKLAGVQCEICHAPAKDHADTQTKLADNVQNWMEAKAYQALVSHAKQVKPSSNADEPFCKKCHTPENDNNFNSGTKFKWVIH